MLYIIKMLFFRAFYETEVQYLNHFFVTLRQIPKYIS